MIRHSIVPALALATTLGGCVTYKTHSDGITRIRIDQTASVDGPRVTPLKLIEDSRCPKGAQCVWAGRVRVTVRINLGQRNELRDLTLGEPQPVADGTLTLVEVLPIKKAGDTLYPDEYRFGFTFAGGF